MKDAIRSLAILRPNPGKTEELIALLREFYTMLYEKRYALDILYYDREQSGDFVHFRLWFSRESRENAVHDPEVHRYWMQLANLATVTTIFEEMETVFSTQTGRESSADPI
jgi:hypothetical protein